MFTVLSVDMPIFSQPMCEMYRKILQYSKMLPFFITLCRWNLCWCVTYLWWSYCSFMSPPCRYFFMLKLDFRYLTRYAAVFSFKQQFMQQTSIADCRAAPLSISLSSAGTPKPKAWSPNPKARTPKPKAQSLKPKARSPKPEARSPKPKPEARSPNLKPKTSKPKLRSSKVRSSKPRSSNLEALTPKPEPRNEQPEPRTLNSEPWTLNPEPWTWNRQPGTLNPEPWTLMLHEQFPSLVISGSVPHSSIPRSFTSWTTISRQLTIKDQLRKTVGLCRTTIYYSRVSRKTTLTINEHILSYYSLLCRTCLVM